MRFSTSEFAKLIVEDGSFRLYGLPEARVKKAVRGLSGAVTGVVFRSPGSRSSAQEEEASAASDVWVSAGRTVCLSAI